MGLEKNLRDDEYSKKYRELNADGELHKSLATSERLKELREKYVPFDNSPGNKAIANQIEQATKEIHLSVFMLQEEKRREALKFLGELKKVHPILECL